jgi:hypothetical protein
MQSPKWKQKEREKKRGGLRKKTRLFRGCCFARVGAKQLRARLTPLGDRANDSDLSPPVGEFFEFLTLFLSILSLFSHTFLTFLPLFVKIKTM